MKEDMRRTSRARRAQQRKRRNRRIALTLCVMFVVLAASIGGTVAWLTDKTGTIENTFTAGDIDITLTETGTDNVDKKNYTFVPGDTLSKDPKVTVEAGSEACWLFVKVEEGNNFSDFMSYNIADGWTKGDGTNIPANVYYREVDAATGTAGVSYYVLKGNTENPNGFVTVKDSVTKELIANKNAAINKPTLTFTAYAVQKANVDTVEAAWNLAKDL